MVVARNIQKSGLSLRSIGATGVLFYDHTPLYVYLLSLFVRHSRVHMASRSASGNDGFWTGLRVAHLFEIGGPRW